MIKRVPCYHLCSLCAHPSRKGSEFENDFTLSYFTIFHTIFLNLWVRPYTSLGDWNFEWNISGQLGWLKQIGQITTGPIVRFFLKILKISISWVCNERKTFHHLSISTWRRWKKNGLRGPFPPASLARTGHWLILGFSKQQSTDATIM